MAAPVHPRPASEAPPARRRLTPSSSARQVIEAVSSAGSADADRVTVTVPVPEASGPGGEPHRADDVGTVGVAPACGDPLRDSPLESGAHRASSSLIG
jgi:hypothetical protein